MEVQQDFRDLLALFNKHKVECAIVGHHTISTIRAVYIGIMVRNITRNSGI